MLEQPDRYLSQDLNHDLAEFFVRLNYQEEIVQEGQLYRPIHLGLAKQD